MGGKPQNQTNTSIRITSSICVTVPSKQRIFDSSLFRGVQNGQSRRCIYLFGVLCRFQHCTGHITTGSWKGRGNQYIQFVRVLYCKLPTNGKQLQFSHFRPCREKNFISDNKIKGHIKTGSQIESTCYLFHKNVYGHKSVIYSPSILQVLRMLDRRR